MRINSQQQQTRYTAIQWKGNQMTKCDKCGLACHRTNSKVTTDGTYLTRLCMNCYGLEGK